MSGEFSGKPHRSFGHADRIDKAKQIVESGNVGVGKNVKRLNNIIGNVLQKVRCAALQQTVYMYTAALIPEGVA